MDIHGHFSLGEDRLLIPFDKIIQTLAVTAVGSCRLVYYSLVYTNGVVGSTQSCSGPILDKQVLDLGSICFRRLPVKM